MQLRKDVKEGVSGRVPTLEEVSRVIFEQDKFLVHCALLSYLKHGRGALFLDMGSSEDSTGLVKTGFEYMTESSSLFASIRDLIGKETTELIRSYDPDTEVILLVRFRDGRVCPIQLPILDSI